MIIVFIVAMALFVAGVGVALALALWMLRSGREEVDK
jgi:hypothetical protein